MQRCQWWKHKSARGIARRGQGFVGTPATVIVSAGTGRAPRMELAMPNSQDFHASATSSIDQVPTILATS
ncbi:hypothetical protein L1049_026046 [Liquidambar formosana]|uniref:Uncharacterized protein n=1 Tax=Liquidambar formosana TaxID=63359 RepID=A0AAP0R8T6_LIQFO